MAHNKNRGGAPLARKRTIQEVAKLAGVTHPTVSRALAGHPQVAAETVRRVRQAALAVGYRPNLFAQALKRGRSPIIGVLANSVTDPFKAQLIGRFEAYARSAGLACLFCDITATGGETQADALDFLLDLPLGGVLLVGEGTANAATTERLTVASRNGLKTVALSASVDAPEIPNISVNQEHVGFLATRHLIATGHRRIAYIGPGANPRRRANSTAAARQHGYELALAEAGPAVGPPVIEDMQEDTKPAAHQLLDRLSAMQDRPTGLFVFNDMEAIAVLGAAMDRGIRVPAEIAVVGVDNLSIGALVSPSLTSVEQPVDQLVSAALDALTLPESNATNRLIEPRLVVRGSTSMAMPHISTTIRRAGRRSQPA